jgi:hypothetical protein
MVAQCGEDAMEQASAFRGCDLVDGMMPAHDGLKPAAA